MPHWVAQPLKVHLEHLSRGLSFDWVFRRIRRFLVSAFLSLLFTIFVGIQVYFLQRHSGRVYPIVEIVRYLLADPVSVLDFLSANMTPLLYLLMLFLVILFIPWELLGLLRRWLIGVIGRRSGKMAFPQILGLSGVLQKLHQICMIITFVGLAIFLLSIFVRSTLFESAVKYADTLLPPLIFTAILLVILELIHAGLVANYKESEFELMAFRYTGNRDISLLLRGIMSFESEADVLSRFKRLWEVADQVVFLSLYGDKRKFGQIDRLLQRMIKSAKGEDKQGFVDALVRLSKDAKKLTSPYEQTLGYSAKIGTRVHIRKIFGFFAERVLASALIPIVTIILLFIFRQFGVSLVP